MGKHTEMKGEPMKKKDLSIVEKLEALIAHYGSIEKASHALGCSARSVWRWKQGGTILEVYKREIDRAYQSLE